MLMAQNNAAARSYPTPSEEWQNPARSPKEQLETLKHARRRPKPAVKTRARVKIFVAVVLVFGICAGLVTRYAQLAVLNTEINSLDAELKKEQANLETLELQKTYATNLSEIEKNAQTKLGMDFPKQDQVIYIQLQQGNDTAQNTDTAGNQ